MTKSLTVRLDPRAAQAACDGHFPGDPLVPGSTLVGFAAETAAQFLADQPGGPWRLVGVGRATFSAPAHPTLAIDLIATRNEAPGGVIVRIHGDGRPLATAHFHFEPAS